MPYPLQRRPVGAPPNTLKKKSSITAGETTNYDEQPWATAHLHQSNRSSAARETTAPEDHTNDNTFVRPESEPTNDNDNTMSFEDADAITPLPSRQVYIDPIAGHSNVTIPAPPRRRHTYSECFDLDDIAPGSQIRSPSGHLLSAEQAAARPDRPIGIKERQEAIRRKVAEQREKGLGNQVTVVGDAERKERREQEKRELKERREREKREKQERLRKKVKGVFECRCIKGDEE